MKIEIWSDIMCPFCYIGKRRFEAALNNFENKDKIEIEWKSFQLNPDMQTDPKKSINEYLSEIKGWSLSQAKAMNASVTEMAKGVGLNYDFDKVVVANSFDAHRLIQLAKKKGKGDVAEERLFKAYFTEGKNIADHDTLVLLGIDIGIAPEETKALLNSKQLSDEVNADIQEAQQLGIHGVPFFVIDRKYGISGAQESSTFLQALQKASADKTTEKR